MPTSKFHGRANKNSPQREIQILHQHFRSDMELNLRHNLGKQYCLYFNSIFRISKKYNPNFF